MKKKDKKKLNKVSSSTMLIAGAIICGVVLVMLVGSIYATRNIYQSKFLMGVVKVLPLPAAVINGIHVVTVREFEEASAAMDTFYKSKDYASIGLRVDFSTEDGKKRFDIKRKELLNKAVEDKAIELIAKEKGVNISDADVDQAVTDKIEEYGNKDDVQRDLLRNYGMTLDDFKEKIVKPSMIKEALMKLVEGENASVNDEAKGKAENALKELKGGAMFADVAKKYSQGASADSGGDLGWVTESQVIPELASELFSDKKKDLQIVESGLGFHIAEVLEKKKDGDQDVIRVRQVFVKKIGFADWLNQQLQKTNVTVFLKGMTWNEKDAVVEFTSQDMKKFEQEITEKAQGDASMIF